MTTLTEIRVLSNVAGGRCQLSLIRDILHHGTPLELRLFGEWHRVSRIVPTINGSPAVDGIRFLMSPDDDIAYRVETGQALWARIPPEARKAGQKP